jgi:muconolactone D-isomerase
MDFLVRLETTLPADMPDDQRSALLAAEAAHGRALIDAGALRAIWRLPGRLANVGIWSAADADRLHEMLVELPLWRWMTVQVTALATHPLMASPPD